MIPASLHTNPKSAGRALPATASAASPLPCTGARLRRLTRRMTSFYEQHLRLIGLKLGQYSLLSRLGSEPQSLINLADALEMDRTTLSRGLQPLLAQGWVAEVRGRDARQRCYVLTGDGLRFRKEAHRHWQRAQLALEDHLGRAFTANLQAQLEQALARLKPALAEDN
jgi:DNA-binding MarR family transcriptional regulator